MTPITSLREEAEPSMNDEALAGIAHAMLMQPWGIGARREDAFAFARAVLRIYGEWYTAPQHGMPPCDGETVYVGINTAGFACCFNEVTHDGVCSMQGPEVCTVQMSGLHWWRMLDRPSHPEYRSSGERGDADSGGVEASATVWKPEPPCWLVERRAGGRTTGYLGHANGSYEWMPTPDKATRFVRREDANGVAECIETADVIVAEHIWG